MKSSSYELLVQVEKSINRLEDKIDARLKEVEDRVEINSTFRSNLEGKIARKSTKRFYQP